jgi:hypothetical protein
VSKEGPDEVFGPGLDDLRFRDLDSGVGVGAFGIEGLGFRDKGFRV